MVNWRGSFCSCYIKRWPDLKKVHIRRTLEDMVTKDTVPLSDEKLNELIHESRK